MTTDDMSPIQFDQYIDMVNKFMKMSETELFKIWDKYDDHSPSTIEYEAISTVMFTKQF